MGQPQALRARARRAVPALGLRHLRQALGLLSLGGLAFCSFVMVTGAAYRPTAMTPARTGGFPLWLRGPLGGLGGFLAYSEFVVWLIVMTGIFLVALLTVPSLPLRWIGVAIVVLHVLFFLGPPILSADVFGYIDWARAGVLHGLNPYSTDSGTVVSDAVHPFVRWSVYGTPYGPLFTLFSYALVPLGVPLNLWALKGSVLVASLGCCALVWDSARRRAMDPRLGLVLYGLNPAVLVYAVGGAHNDVLMMLAVLLAVWLLLGGRERGAAVAGSLAVAVKASAGLVIPFLILGSRRRLSTLIAALATGAVVLAVSLVAFGSHAFDFIDVLRTQQNLDSGTSVSARLGLLFGWTGNPPAVRTVASTVFVVTVAGLLWRTWRRPGEWLESAGWATFALMACTSWLLAWYAVWLMPLAALARSRWLVMAAAAATVFVILTRTVPFL